MKKIDKSFKSQQEIFAWLGSGGKVCYKSTGHIISFQYGILMSGRDNEPVIRDFAEITAWEKVLLPSWEDFLEEYDLLAYISDYENFVKEKTARINFLLGRDVDVWKDIDNCPWKFAQPVELSDFEILEGKWLGRKKEKECSTE